MKQNCSPKTSLSLRKNTGIVITQTRIFKIEHSFSKPTGQTPIDEDIMN